MLTKKDLKQRFKIGHNTVYRTLQVCPLDTKKISYSEAEIEQYFVPARQMLQKGKTYQEVEQYFAESNLSEDVIGIEEIKTKSTKSDLLNTAIPAPSSATNNVSNHNNLSQKRLRITYYTNLAAARLAKVSKRELVISCSRLASTIRNIHQVGGTILNIIELA